MKRKTSRLLSLLLALCMVLSLLPGTAVAASSGTWDYLTWTLDDNGTLTISGTGRMPNSSIPYDRDSVKTVIIEKGVTSIADAAFVECSGLTSVKIPDSVTSIGDRAFSGCSSLTNVTLPNSVISIGDRAFQFCSSLTGVTIPNSVTSIGDYAFYSCTGLTGSLTLPNRLTSIGEGVFYNCPGLTGDVTIPDGVISIGDFAFSECAGLTGVTISNSVKSIGRNAFTRCNLTGDLTIPNSVISIGDYAFNYCASLTGVTIPNSVTSIGRSAFFSCTGLKNVVIPDSVTSINDGTFGYCSGLTNIEIPSSVTSIGTLAFWGCTRLESIEIPDSVISIGDRAFDNCSSLTSVTIPDSVTFIDSAAFSGCSYLRDIYYGGSETQWKSLAQDVNIPDTTTIHYAVTNGEREGTVNLTVDGGYLIFDTATQTIIGSSVGVSLTSIPRSINGLDVLAIGDEAFKDRLALTKLTIPGTVKTIGDNAFDGCTGLESVRPSTTLTSIGKKAFANCTSLTSFEIPENTIDIIPEGLFSGCTGLESVTIPANVTEIEKDAFANCSKLSDIYFGGTEEEWDSVTKADPIPSTVQVHCSSSGNIVPYAVTGGNIYFNVDTLTVVRSDKSITAATIPINIDGVPVEAIGAKAFENCSKLTSISFRADITSIGDYAFSGCSSLESITIPSKVTSIPEGMFFRCTALEYVVLPDSTAQNPSKVTSIEDYAFYNCISLSAINLPDQVTNIGDYAFSDCEKLKYIGLPDGLTSLGANAFSDCTSLAEIAIPSNVKTIGASAFSDCTSLTYAEIVGSVTKIEESVFSGCTQLWRVSIPKTVTTIAQNAFLDTDVSNVDYGGERDQWDKITINSGNDMLKRTTPDLIINTWKYFSFSNLGYHFFNDYGQGGTYKHSLGDNIDALDILLSKKANGSYLWAFLAISYKWMKDGWGGICYGIAALEGMLNTPNCYQVQKLDKNATDITDVPFPRDNENVRNLVEYYWFSQMLPESVYNDQGHQYEIGTGAANLALQKLIDNVLNEKPCMINYYANGSGSGHAIIVEGGRKTSYGYELIGRDNNYHGLRSRTTSLSYTSIIKISKNLTSCIITIPEAHVTIDGTDQDYSSEDKIVDTISVYDRTSFQHFAAIDPESVISSAQVLAIDDEPETALFYYLPKNTAANSLILEDSSGNALVSNMSASDDVPYFKYLTLGGTLKDDNVEYTNGAVGLMAELDSASVADYTTSGIDGTCIYLASDGLVAVSTDNTNATAKIDLANQTVTLQNNTGEFSITVVTAESDTMATVSGEADAKDEITVTANEDGSIYLDAPEGEKYDVTFEDEDGNEVTVSATGGDDVLVKKPVSREIKKAPAANGTVSVASEAMAGAEVTITATPNNGYATSSVTVTEDNSGNSVDVKDNGDGTYTFTMPDNSVTVSVSFTSTGNNTGNNNGNGNGSGNGSGTPSGSDYQITAPTAENGTVTVTPKSAKAGDKVTVTAKPDDGYTVGSVTIKDSKGNTVEVTDNGDGTYTFTMPSGTVTVDVVFVPAEEKPSEEPWTNPFSDVSESDWFYDDVAYVVGNGLMIGTGNNKFNPRGTTTRGMIMTILARMAGADTSGGDPWYQPGMEWAVKEGVSDGTRPEGEITREQFVTMLWRYAGEPAATGSLSAYPDADKVHDWASDAMAWAVENGIVYGTDDGKLDPQGNALRSQAAALLTRFCTKIEK